MRPTVTLAREKTPDGVEMVLYEHDGVYTLRLDGYELMSSRAHGSEDELARLPCEMIAGVRAPRVLVAGLGFGFTLRSALDHLPAAAAVTVCEVFASLIRWNRELLGHLADHPLDDRRVRVVHADVASLLGPRPIWDVILVDVDNGPEAFTLRSNAHLYGAPGSRVLAGALRQGGVLAVWSATPDRAFERRLARAGLEARTIKVPARSGGRGPLHYLFLGRRAQSRGGRGKKAEVRRT